MEFIEPQAAIAFIFYKEKFLILKRYPSQYSGGKWGLVGGKVQVGERPEDTLLRELQEEIGLHALPHEKVDLGVHTVSYPDRD